MIPEVRHTHTPEKANAKVTFNIIDPRYSAIIEKFGAEKQMLKTIEELSELQTAICKTLLTPGEPFSYNLYEEIADVEIMLEQMKLIIKDDNSLNSVIGNIKENKLNRMIEKIAKIK